MSKCLDIVKVKTVGILNVLKVKLQIAGDWVYNWISPEFQIPTFRITHFIEGFFGALLKSDRISESAKRSWLSFHSVSSTSVLASTITYMLIQKRIPPYRFIHAFTPVVSEVTMLFTFYIFYRFARTTEIGKKLEKLHLEICGQDGQRRDWSLELRLVLKYLLLPIMFLIVKPILFLLLSDEGDIEWDDIEIYVYPSPIIEYVTTSTQFLLVQFYQIVTYAPITTSTKFFVEIAESIQDEYLFQFRQLKTDMETLAKKLDNTDQPVPEPQPSTSTFEPRLAIEMQDLSSQMNAEIRGKINEYEKGLISSMERYQTLVSSFVSFRNQLEYGFAVLLIFVYPWLIYSVTEVALHFSENLIDSLVIVGFCFIHLHVIHSCCELGERFQGMVEMIYQETCAIPWYRLSPRMKKIVYIFLHRTQQSVKFRSLKVIVVNRQTFKRMLLILYSIVIICVIINKRRY